MRDSKVGSLYCNSIEFSATLQIGDSTGVYPFSIARAVQKENPIFIKDYITDDETIIKEPLPKFLKPVKINVNRTGNHPIRVKTIQTIGITGSSVLHVGSFDHGKAISIVRHKRILQND
ncbi:spore germination protein GerPE [Piscibacillus salipiscarius]|uniref:Spore germination protein GerPE n=1 Tax=Piscibacillus salipiscarius TaxID=299480 RepID=A0ABW5QCC1_9BACI|nr:spore germination protein GerPE [Piscibacillus salipiscarius]